MTDACLLDCAVAGVPRRIIGIAPALASEKLLKGQGLKINDIEVADLNEAFASQRTEIPPIFRLGRISSAPSSSPVEVRRRSTRPTTLSSVTPTTTR